MELNHFNFITLVSLFQATLLLIVFLFSKKGNLLSNKIFASLLAVFVCQILFSFMTSNWAYEYFLHNHKLMIVIYQANFMTGPLILLYIKSISDRNYSFSIKDAAHFIPFLFIETIQIAHITVVKKYNIWESHPQTLNSIAILVHNFIYIICILLFIIDLKKFYISLCNWFYCIC